MVKKSLFARLFSRNDRNGDRQTGLLKRGGAAPVSRLGGRFEDREERQPEDRFAARCAGDPGGSAPPVELPEAPRRVTVEPAGSKPAEGPPIKASEMPRHEELSLKLKEGFQGISSVLNGIDRKIDRHQETSNELMVTVRKIPEMMKDVPDASRVGLELLATISTILESQGKATGELLSRLGGLPQAMGEFEQRFHDQIAALSQTNAQAEKAARDTQQQLAQAFADVRTTVDDLSAKQARRQDDMLREMRAQQAVQEERVDDLIRRSNSSTKLVVFLIAVVIAALLLVVQQL
ncbi:MAG: hypothetical protein HY812_05345 [Planctomycetes bacterium]|nr:hypothetical protein [Planctomycetota bacterium]